MRTIKFMLLLAFSSLLFSCDDNNDSGYQFDTSSLKQTKWKGTFTDSYYSSGKERVNNANVGIIFYSETDGEYSVEYGNGTSPVATNFKYSIDGNLLKIQYGLTLGGHWLAVQIDKNKMVLEKGTSGDDSYNATLTLSRAN